ncbi:LytR/AlgR family response regulator transcription factor [Tumebacillus lipolyticus]|uniref:LytR/AlgR family response regulator transcription factor n=1 Tax=Tumebacillus lipolyticus TaxID=1280370 RepID=A0ABW4ZYP4_9BACL
MRVMLADDELLPLVHLKRMLECDIGGVEVIGTYSDPIQVITMANALRPDAVFLDINMPEISGLEIARQLKMSLPDIEIVFVTGYDHYAVQAFELCAVDYMMKPVQLERLKQTVQRLQSKANRSMEIERHVEPERISYFYQVLNNLPVRR